MSPPSPAESIGPLLTRLRLRRGHSQLRLAEQLCAASGVPTISRHEVSRWEREERVPGPFWLGWLAAVLEVPIDRLATAAGAARIRAGSRTGSPIGAGSGPGNAAGTGKGPGHLAGAMAARPRAAGRRAASVGA